MFDKITTSSMSAVERVLIALFEGDTGQITLNRGHQILDTAKSFLDLMAFDEDSALNRSTRPSSN